MTEPVSASRSDDDLPGMLAVAKGIAEQTWPHTMDAAKWAAAFCQRYPGIDEGSMIGWFANAIMAGYDTAQARSAVSERGRWIAITESLPQVDEHVLLFFGGEHCDVREGYLSKIGKVRNDDIALTPLFVDATEQWEGDRWPRELTHGEITHWMPMPSAPSAERPEVG